MTKITETFNVMPLGNSPEKPAVKLAPRVKLAPKAVAPASKPAPAKEPVPASRSGATLVLIEYIGATKQTPSAKPTAKLPPKTNIPNTPTMSSPLPPPPPARPRVAVAKPPVPVRPARAPIEAPAIPEASTEVGKFAAVVDVLFFLAAAAGVILLLLEFMAREYK